MKCDKAKFANTIRDEFGNKHIQTYYVECELPGKVIANMYETNIHKPMLKALKNIIKVAPKVIDLDGKLKPCITPVEKSIISRFNMLDGPKKPIYTNERSKLRYTDALDTYYRLLPHRIYDLLKDFDKCASFITDLDYAIRMSSLNFLKALCILSKQYLPSEIDKLLSRRTPEDRQIDKNRQAYYAKNNELLREAQERNTMTKELEYMNNFMVKEAKIREQQEKEHRKLIRKETKTKKLQEKDEKMRLQEERATKQMQKDQEKALRAILREQLRSKKLTDKLHKDAQRRQKNAQNRIKEAELTEKYTYKMLRTMFV